MPILHLPELPKIVNYGSKVPNIGYTDSAIYFVDIRHPSGMGERVLFNRPGEMSLYMDMFEAIQANKLNKAIDAEALRLDIV